MSSVVYPNQDRASITRLDAAGFARRGHVVDYGHASNDVASLGGATRAAFR